MKSGSAEFGVVGAAGGGKLHTHVLSAAGQAQISVRGVAPYLRANAVAGSFTSTSQVGASTTTSVSQTEPFATPLMGATDNASMLQPYLTLTPLIKT